MKNHQIDKIKKLDSTAFDEKLRAMAEDGVFDSAMEENLERLFDQIEPTKLHINEKNAFYKTVTKASVENVIMEARAKTPVSNLPLGRFLQSVRDRSGLSHAQVAHSLNKKTSFIERLENGQINPLKLMVKDVANIMQMFRLTITDIITTLNAFIATNSAKGQRIKGMARTSIKSDAGDKGDRLAHAMDALQAAIEKKKSHGRVEAQKIEPTYIDTLKQELIKRNAKDLLI